MSTPSVLPAWSKAYPSLSFEIKGTTTILSNTTVTTNGWVSQGESGPDDTIDVTIHRERLDIFSNESGPRIPATSIGLGIWATITVPMVMWNNAGFNGFAGTNGIESLFVNTGVGTPTAPAFIANKSAALGQMGLGIPTFVLGVQPTNPGSTGYVFPYVQIIDDQKLPDWGKKESKSLITLRALPVIDDLSNANNLLYYTFQATAAGVLLPITTN